MKYLKLYYISLIFSLFIFTTNSYAKEYDFVLIEKEVQNGINKKTKYGLAKITKANSILRALSFSQATSQEEIIPPIYDLIEEVYSDFFSAIKGSKMGLFDKEGKMVFPVIYDGIEELDKHFFITYNNNRTGLARRNGEILLGTNSTSIPKFRGGYAVINSFFKDSTGRSTLINRNGEVVLDLTHNILQGRGFTGINHIGDNFYTFLKDKSWGLLDDQSNIIIDPAESNYNAIIPADLKPYSEQIPKKYSLKAFILDKPNPSKSYGRTIKWHNVDAISYIGDDLFLYFKDEKFGIINRKREIIEAFKYDKMSLVDKTYMLLENSQNEKESFKIKTSEANSLSYIIEYVAF